MCRNTKLINMTTILVLGMGSFYIVRVAFNNAASAAMQLCFQLSFNYLLKLSVTHCPCCIATACCSLARLDATRHNAKSTFFKM